MNSKDIFEIKDINQIISDYKLEIEKIPMRNTYDKLLKKLKKYIRHEVIENKTLLETKESFIEYYIRSNDLICFNYKNGVIQILK